MDSSSNEMEKGTELQPEFLKGLFNKGEGAGELWPCIDEEFADEITIVEQEGPDMPTPKLIESTGGRLQRFLGGLNQADSERAIKAAHQKYAAYRKSQDVAFVDEAFEHYMEASRGVRRREWRLLYGCSSAAVIRYWRDGKTQQDLARLVRIGNEAMVSWTSTMEPPDFGVRMAYVIGKANKDIYLQSIKKKDAGKSNGNEEAFKLAQKCFKKVIEETRVRNLSRGARMELGILIVLRRKHTKVARGLHTAILHLEYALKEVTQREETPSTSGQRLLITIHLMLAFLYLYGAQVRNRITYPFTRSGRLRNVNSALDYLEQTRAQLELRKITFKGIPAMFQLAFGALLTLRWVQTKKLSDLERAKTALETARVMEGLDEKSKLKAEKFLSKLAQIK